MNEKLIDSLKNIMIILALLLSIILYVDTANQSFIPDRIFKYSIAILLIIIVTILIYFTFSQINKLHSRFFDKNHSLVNAALPIAITTAASIILFVIGTDNKEVVLQQQLFVHLALVIIILSLFFYVIDFLITIQKQNQLVNYMLIKNQKVFPKLFKIYKSFNDMNQKEKISKLEEDLFNEELDKISGNIQDISRGKYELKSAKFNLFWKEITDEIKKIKNANYYSITDFSQDGNLTSDRLDSLEKSLNSFKELKNIEIRKLIICSDKVKVLDKEIKKRIYDIVCDWSKVASNKDNRIELRYINYDNIFDDLIGKNLDIGIFENIAVGFQLSANSSSDKNKANSTLRYVIHFDEHYIEKSRIDFNELWDISSEKLPKYIECNNNEVDSSQ